MKQLLTGALCALMIASPALAQRADGPRPQRGDRMERPQASPDRTPRHGERNIDRGLERRAERFQYRTDRNDRPERRAERYRDERQRHDRYDRRRANDRPGPGRVDAPDRFGYGRGPWYAAPYRTWARGQYIPRGYWSGGWSPYIVADWGGYGLYRPPYGHAWVRYHDDLLLVVLASGLVREILRGGWRDRWDDYDDGYYDPRY